MRSEIADMPEVEVLDRRIGAVGQQRRPVIIGADLHPPLVDANGDRGVDSAIVLAVAARKQAAHAVHHLSPVTTIGPNLCTATGKRGDRKSTSLNSSH